MKKALALLYRSPWPHKVLAVTIVAAVVVCVRLLPRSRGGIGLIGGIGAIVAWVCALAASALLVGSAIQWLKRRRAARDGSPPKDTTLPSSLIVSNLAVVAGSSLILAVLPALLRTFSEASLGVLLGGVALALLGIWRMGVLRVGVPTVLQGRVIPLCLIVIAFVGPREEGWIRLNLSENTFRIQSAWAGGGNCIARGVPGQVSIRRFRPALTWSKRGLSGSVGDIIARRLRSHPSSNAASARLRGDIALGDGCYSPFFKSVNVSGTIELDILLALRKPNVKCSAHQTLSYQIDATMKGLASCRDLKLFVAKKLLAVIVKRARQITGCRN